MKTKKKKLSFTKATIIDLESVKGGLDAKVTDTHGSSCVHTNCDDDTLCYNVSRCMTVCGGPFC